MYIIKNALSNLIRNKGRNTIIAIIIFSVIFITSVSFMIHTSSKELIKQYKAQFGSEVVIVRNDDKLPKDISKFEIPSKELLDNLAKSEYLKEVTKTMTTAVRIEGIKTVNEGNVPGAGSSAVPDNESSGTSSNDENVESPNAIIYASTNPDISNEFRKGQRNIVEGSVYKNKEKDKGMISKQLAEKSGLKVGDVLTLKSTDINPDNKNSYRQQIRITAIYDDLVPQPNQDQEIALSTRANEVYISFSSLTDSKLFMDGLYDMYMTLQDPKNLPKLQKEFYKKGLPKYYEVKTDPSTYGKIVGPVEALSNITLIFTYVTIGVGIIILSIISLITVRERKYEIGVLRAIGMKKRKIMLGFIVEALVITAVAMSLGIGLASCSSEPIANSMFTVHKKTASSNENSAPVEAGIQISDAALNEIKEIKPVLDKDVMVKISGVSILLVVVNSILGVLFIARYEPMKILTERN